MPQMFPIPLDLSESRISVNVPTFDQWFEAKHGMSFERMHMGTFTRYEDSVRALTVALRDYTSEMARMAYGRCI